MYIIFYDGREHCARAQLHILWLLFLLLLPLLLAVAAVAVATACNESIYDKINDAK